MNKIRGQNDTWISARSFSLFLKFSSVKEMRNAEEVALYSQPPALTLSRSYYSTTTAAGLPPGEALPTWARFLPCNTNYPLLPLFPSSVFIILPICNFFFLFYHLYKSVLFSFCEQFLVLYPGICYLLDFFYVLIFYILRI